MVVHSENNILENANFSELDLHQLERQLKQLERNPSAHSIATLRTLRRTIHERKRLIKSRVMSFESSNHNHILVFDSTENFTKIAGRSVLFYTMLVAPRIHRRYSVKYDTDDYFRSETGIISLRAYSQLVAELTEINILPDKHLSSSELHFFKLPHAYTDQQIAKLSDRSLRDADRIKSIILPRSPLPELYQLLLDLNRLVYHNGKHITEPLARSTLVNNIVRSANEALVSYLNYASAKDDVGFVHVVGRESEYLRRDALKPSSARAHDLLNILLSTRDLRNNLANFYNLRLLHHQDLREILEKIAEIERIVGREYLCQLRRDQHS